MLKANHPHPIEAAAMKEAVEAAYGILGELDEGLGFLHLLMMEQDHAGHLGLEATVALWKRAVRSVLDEKAAALEAAVNVLGGYSALEDAA